MGRRRGAWALVVLLAAPARAGLDPFVSETGRPIRTPAEWASLRRPELKRLFEEHVYGRAPAPRAVSVVRTEERPFAGGRHRLRQVDLAIEGTRRVLHLALFLPGGSGRAPTFVALNKCGNPEVHPDPALRPATAWLPPACAEEGWDRRGGHEGFWAVEAILDAGFGLATFHESDLEPDRPGADGIRGELPSSWGAVAAWAWGLSRAADYLVRAPGVDPAGLIVTGHSRRGKAALLAAALDERFALAAPHQSGTGGTALSRGNRRETVARINADYPHWFAPAFRAYGGDPMRLPVDQDLLVALVAPRPVLDTQGRLDPWSNAPSALDGLRRADAVYRFLGVPGLVGDGLLEEGEDPAAAGRLAQHRRWTGHTMDAGYWRAIMGFARANLTPAPRPLRRQVPRPGGRLPGEQEALPRPAQERRPPVEGHGADD